MKQLLGGLPQIELLHDRQEAHSSLAEQPLASLKRVSAHTVHNTAIAAR